MPYQGGSIQLGPWTEGVVYNRPPEDVAANELSSMRNCRINAAGAVEKRKGFASFNDQVLFLALLLLQAHMSMITLAVLPTQ